MSADPQARKELLKYLLMQVKEKELDVDRAKEFIRAIGDAAPAEHDPVAVVGIACRFPGAADKEQYWSNLIAGRESIGDFPAQRIEDLRRVEGGAATVRKGGYLDRIDLFDPEYFGIPPQVAVQLDPYHRTLMEVLVETMEDAGYAKSELHGSTTGIFVGNDHTHRLITSYLPFLAETDFGAVTGSWSGILASRLAYHLNLRGPAQVIDTGCSSGLVALDAAMKAIGQGDCDAAFVGAANLFLSPSNLGNETESGDDRVRAFDVAANGTVWSEGVAGVYVKPLSRAVADRDHVYGVILSSAVNNDGRSNGLTAPNAQAQKDLLVNAWRRAGISPESLSSIEAHGTGTALGDPIEIKGLTEAFAEFTGKRQFCALGSVKTNIGHTVGAAGLASLIKTLLSVERGLIPPSIHFDVPNQYLDLARSPVYVNDRLTEWEPGPTSRRAGVSSFSLSGTNCHVVVEQAPVPAERPVAGHGAYLYPISARNEELLARTAATQLAFLDRHPDYRLDDVCFTMQAGREHQPVRAVVLCDGRDGLRAGLLRLLRPVTDEVETLPDGRTVVRAAPQQPATDTESRAPGANPPENAGSDRRIDLPDRFRHLTDAVDGFLEDRRRPFQTLHQGVDLRRVPLPAQLFDRVRLWDETVRPAAAANSPREAAPDPADRVRDFASEPSRIAGEPEAPAVRRVIGGVWSDVLGYPVIRGTDDFFALGGDSVSSVKITQLLNAAFGLDIPAPTLLARPVFDDFAAAVATEYGLDDERIRTRPERTDAAAQGPAEVAEEYELPLTASQRSMYVSSKLTNDSVAYNISGLTIRQGALDVAMLEESLHTLVRRHDSLRSTFHLVHGEPLQRIHADVRVPIEHHRLAGPTDSQSHESLAQQWMSAFVRPFRLDEEPPFRVGYLEFDDGVSCLAIDVHHIVTDGASMGILFRDLTATIEGATLPRLERSYRSAIRERLQRQSEADLLPHRNYWVSRFADGVPTLHLPTDRQRPDVADPAGAMLFASLDEELLDAAKRYARDHDLTLSMVLLGTFHQVLARMSAQHDVVIGTPVMGRPDLTYQNLVGMFVNTLPLRITGTATTCVRDFLTEVKSTVLGAFEHQDYPLDAMIEELDPPREPGRRAMFDVYFAHQNIDMGQEHDDERYLLFDDGTAKYDLTLSTREADGGLLMEWEYATALFRRDTVELISDRYVRLLRSVITATGAEQVGALELIPEREADLIRRLATIPARAPRETLGVVGLFEQQVASHPDATALIMDDDRLSYGELNAAANRVAHHLIGQGLPPGSAVAILLDRSFDLVTAMLGVLKAGCVYVPLNTEFPTERLQVMLTDSGAGILLTGGARTAQAAALASDGLDVVDVRTCAEETGTTADPGLPSSSDDPIYIMYTSGTTGAPKGSVTRQRGVLRVAHRASFADADRTDVFLMLSDYSFDGSVYDMYGALTNGAALVIMDKESVLDFERVAATIAEHRVTRFFITTAMFNALIDIAPDALRGIRRVVFGGEIVSPAHVHKAYESLGPGRLAHAYGPTETTVFATVHVLDDIDDDTIPIGRPIDDTSLWVLDENRGLTPIGAQGELYIGGGGLADGYLNLPDLTAQRFVTSPAVPGVRLYRTGDLVTLRGNGLVYYNARLDQQVKLRGYRIELAEIIHVALEQPAVRWAHAGLVEVAEGNTGLCLWVQYADGHAPDDAALRAALQRRLPAYMVPSFIVGTDEVRLNKNGKVDAAALPMPRFSGDEAAARPESDLEQRIAAAWSHVLGISVADVDENFFALGGDSIKAIQIVAKLKEHDVAIQVTDLLESQTVRSLAQLVADGADQGTGPPVYDQAPLSGPVTAGPVQRAFLDDPANHARVFTQCLLVTPEEPLSAERLAQGLERVVGHHDMLRVHVDDDGGLSIRDVDAGRTVHTESAPEDLSEADTPAFLKSLQARVDARRGPVVALATGLGPQRRQFAVAVHHLAVDVVSWGVLLGDLLACVADPDAELMPTSMPFPAWTAELERHARAGGFRTQLPYWTAVARRAGAVDRPFAEDHVTRGETVSCEVRLDEASAQEMFDAARETHGLDAGRVLLAAVARAVAGWAGRDQVLFTLEGHGREPFAGDHDVTRTIGWFTSTFPHLVSVGHDAAATVDAVRRSFDALPDKGFGFGPLVRFDPDPGEGRMLLAGIRPQISFNYLGDLDGHRDGVAVVHLPADITVDDDYPSSHVLDIIASRRDGAVLVDLRHPRTWRDGDGAADLAAAVATALREVHDAVTSGAARGIRTSSLIEADVLDDILVDLVGGG